MAGRKNQLSMVGSFPGQSIISDIMKGCSIKIEDFDFWIVSRTLFEYATCQDSTDISFSITMKNQSNAIIERSSSYLICKRQINM